MTLPTLPPIHPGEILREEFLVPLGMSAADLAIRLGVPAADVEQIAAERAPITDDMAMRLGKHFRTSAEVWIGMQRSYDVKTSAR